MVYQDHKINYDASGKSYLGITFGNTYSYGEDSNSVEPIMTPEQKIKAEIQEATALSHRASLQRLLIQRLQRAEESKNLELIRQLRSEQDLLSW
ncbi:MAG: hypothetical protein AAGG51_25535 [Cyanobacteria bacterium P01_G01_bin.54]